MENGGRAPASSASGLVTCSYHPRSLPRVSRDCRRDTAKDVPRPPSDLSRPDRRELGDPPRCALEDSRSSHGRELDRLLEPPAERPVRHEPGEPRVAVELAAAPRPDAPRDEAAETLPLVDSERRVAETVEEPLLEVARAEEPRRKLEELDRGLHDGWVAEDGQVVVDDKTGRKEKSAPRPELAARGSAAG